MEKLGTIGIGLDIGLIWICIVITGIGIMTIIGTPIGYIIAGIICLWVMNRYYSSIWVSGLWGMLWPYTLIHRLFAGQLPFQLNVETMVEKDE